MFHLFLENTCIREKRLFTGKCAYTRIYSICMYIRRMVYILFSYLRTHVLLQPREYRSRERRIKYTLVCSFIPTPNILWSTYDESTRYIRNGVYTQNSAYIRNFGYTQWTPHRCSTKCKMWDLLTTLGFIRFYVPDFYTPVVV